MYLGTLGTCYDIHFSIRQSAATHPPITPITPLHSNTPPPKEAMTDAIEKSHASSLGPTPMQDVLISWRRSARFSLGQELVSNIALKCDDGNSDVEMPIVTFFCSTIGINLSDEGKAGVHEGRGQDGFCLFDLTWSGWRFFVRDAVKCLAPRD